MNYTFGFIGVGNMGGALASAAKNGNADFSAILSDVITEKAEMLANKLGCVSGDVKTVAKTAKYIFLGVKPQVIGAVIDEISPILDARDDRFVLVSMAAGVAIDKISRGKYPVIRIMPNIAAFVGEAMILCAKNDLVTDGEVAEFNRLMSESGKITELDEKLFDAGCALSGSGPAYVFMFIEALADGAVACGLPRDKALDFATQTV